MEEPQEKKDEMMDLEETDDQDFDMFLEEKDNDRPTTPPGPEALQAAFNDLAQFLLLDQYASGLDYPSRNSRGGASNRRADNRIWFPALEDALSHRPAPHRWSRACGQVGPVFAANKNEFLKRTNCGRILLPSSDANAGFQILADFLIAKGRHGLVFPWGSRPKEYHPGKELYIIPLLSSDSLPDYMELLDNLTLPKIRNTNYLVGIWVLNKGKLAPPPPPPPAITPVPPPPAPNPAVMPQPPPQFHMPTMPGVPAPQLTFEPSVLAAEVAALTPEQVRMMLQSLTASTLNSIPVANPIPPPPPQQPVIPPPQAWGHPPMPGPGPGPGMGMGYPQHYPPPQQQHGPPYGQQPPYDQRRDYNRDPHQGYDHGGRENGWNRGRGRGRGRGGPGGGGGGPPHRL
ncbi:Transcription elongation regulator [Mycena sanguinolenta]|uniref:Transcription elongation regulator n=1 Tax=Mycena sanguinolenta TaxID=230812 RepID=A0A8H7DDP7_9AGAR|nr:Transcription elongation regulator [Mycena sanguinolenta]